MVNLIAALALLAELVAPGAADQPCRESYDSLVAANPELTISEMTPYEVDAFINAMGPPPIASWDRVVIFSDEGAAEVDFFFKNCLLAYSPLMQTKSLLGLIGRIRA